MNKFDTDTIEFIPDDKGCWIAVDTLGKISINVLSEKVNVFHSRLESFDDLLDVVDYIQTLTGKEIILKPEENYNV